jgi:hypothetical protein
VLQLEKLLAKFHALGFSNMRAIAQVMADKTGSPYFANYRALLYMASSPKYFALLEETLEKLKQE